MTDRRRFLSCGLAVSAGACLLAGGASKVQADVPELVDRTLRLVNAHTWEKQDITYCVKGNYDADSLGQINYLMRDHRRNVATSMDVNLLDTLVRLHASLETDEAIHVLSGYRTPETNAALRKQSLGVAKFSLHMSGKAADIYIPGIATRTLQEAALAMQAGGVGYYGKSGFVHIDSGRIRHWERG
ncbi:MAG: DUF882 domain-containing protein [Granulosicoccus sp.]